MNMDEIEINLYLAPMMIIPPELLENNSIYTSCVEIESIRRQKEDELYRSMTDIINSMFDR